MRRPARRRAGDRQELHEQSTVWSLHWPDYAPAQCAVAGIHGFLFYERAVKKQALNDAPG
jgi:hypothetical protein